MGFRTLGIRGRRRLGGLLFAVGLLSAALLGVPEARGLDYAPVPAPTVPPVEQPSDSAPPTMNLVVGKGDTLYGMLGRAGISAAGRAAVMGALENVFDPRTLRPGDKVRLVLEARAHDVIVRSLHLDLGAHADLTIDVAPPRATGKAAPRAAGRPHIHRITGTVGPSFRQSLKDAGLPARLVNEAALAFRFDPDAPDLPPATGRFEVVYETPSATAGDRQAELLSVTLDDGRKVHRVYRYRINRAATAFVHPNGKGIEVIKFARPLRGGQISSPFGWRIHPVFGDWRFHRGVDIRAPRGTPVLASADGVVEEAGWRGNYGRYIRIRHTATVETTYSHLSGFARGLRAGERVRQGQVIGYVGRTGVATGNHLYYELLVDGEAVDPLDPPEVFPARLDGRQLTALKRSIRSAAAD